jgi:hypothetical protein
MAQSGHCHRAAECPLSGVKRTLGEGALMSACDPKADMHHCYTVFGLQLTFSVYSGCFWMGFAFLKMQSDETAAALPHPPKVIIFDFDGVILDSADIKLRAFRRVKFLS